jgi:hypothetical protein
MGKANPPKEGHVQITGKLVKAGEGPIVWRGGCKNSVGAKLVPAGLAVEAGPARLARLERNAVTFQRVLRVSFLCFCFSSRIMNGDGQTFLEVLDVRADSDDDAGRLVAEDHRGLYDEVSDTAMSLAPPTNRTCQMYPNW